MGQRYRYCRFSLNNSNYYLIQVEPHGRIIIMFVIKHKQQKVVRESIHLIQFILGSFKLNKITNNIIHFIIYSVYFYFTLVIDDNTTYDTEFQNISKNEFYLKYCSSNAVPKLCIAVPQGYHMCLSEMHTKIKLDLDELVFIYYAYYKFLLWYLCGAPRLKLIQKGHHLVKILGAAVLI